MRYCPRCKTDVFGGSICDRCGGKLVEKRTAVAPKAVHVPRDKILEGPKRLKSELAQSKVGRLFRLLLEIVLFCLIFYGVSWVGHVIVNFLHIQMSENPEKTKPIIFWFTNGSWAVTTSTRYYLYAGGAIVTTLTIWFRWAAGK